MAENFTSMIEITRFENDMVVIEGNRCPFCGDEAVYHHYLTEMKCSNDLLAIVETKYIDIDQTNDKTQIFDDLDIYFEIWCNDEDFAVFTLYDEVLWREK